MRKSLRLALHTSVDLSNIALGSTAQSFSNLEAIRD